jgi:hypothetical protein
MQKEFETRLEYFRDLFGLENWKIGLIWQENNVEGEKLTGLDTYRSAKTLANPTYNQATITIYPQLLEKKELWDETIIHELVHIVMAGLDFYTDNVVQDKDQQVLFVNRENAVSQLTSIICRMLKKGTNVPKGFLKGSD